MSGAFRWLLDNGGNPTIIILWDHTMLLYSWVKSLITGDYGEAEVGPAEARMQMEPEVRCLFVWKTFGQEKLALSLRTPLPGMPRSVTDAAAWSRVVLSGGGAGGPGRGPELALRTRGEAEVAARGALQAQAVYLLPCGWFAAACVVFLQGTRIHARDHTPPALSPQFSIIGVYVTWFIMSWFIFVYGAFRAWPYFDPCRSQPHAGARLSRPLFPPLPGLVIYNLLGSDAEVRARSAPCQLPLLVTSGGLPCSSRRADARNAPPRPRVPTEVLLRPMGRWLRHGQHRRVEEHREDGAASRVRDVRPRPLPAHLGPPVVREPHRHLVGDGARRSRTCQTRPDPTHMSPGFCV